MKIASLLALIGAVGMAFSATLPDGEPGSLRSLAIAISGVFIAFSAYLAHENNEPKPSSSNQPQP